MILDCWHDERIDESESLTFEIPVDDVKAYLLKVDHEIEWEGRRFFVHEIDDIRTGDDVRKRCTALALWYRLNDPTYVGSLVLSQQTTEDGLTTILDGTGWTVDPTTTASPTLFSMEQQDKTRLALLRSWAQITNTFVVWNTLTKTVALVDTRGEDRGVSFRYRRNLRRIRRRERPPEATVLYPYGAQGLNIAGVNGGEEFLEDFTFYTAQGLTLEEARARFTRSRVWSDPTFLIDSELLAAAQSRMDRIAAALVSYEMDVVTLTDITGVSEPVYIGDTVLVADEVLGINIDTTVVRRRQYPLEPYRDEVELGQLPDVLASSAPSSREQLSNEWVMFVDDNAATYMIRNDGNYLLNRLPLDFRAGGQAHWHLDFFAEGVGDGVLVVEVVDFLTASTVYRSLRVPYTDGEISHGSMQWAEVERDGGYDYRVRFTTEASGGPDPANGVDILPAESRFFVLALGAVQQTPSPGDDSITFTFTGAVQEWDVPDDVTAITITAKGAQGGCDTSARAGGGVVTATVPVTPGQTLDIYVGGSTTGASGGWPDGGAGDNAPGGNGFGGGGSSRVIPDGLGLADALVVAAGGGGSGDQFTGWAQIGGDGGFFVGAPGVTGAPNGGVSPGGGATQFAGGAGGAGGTPGSAGSFGAGGDGGNATLGTHFPPGGGGGGWYGGGGGGVNAVGAGNCGGGGGGSGYVIDDAYDLTFEDGTNFANGEITITWELP